MGFTHKTEKKKIEVINKIWCGSLMSCTKVKGVISIAGHLQFDPNKNISKNVHEGVSSNRRVTVKFDEASKINREMNILSQLDHPNILKFYYDCLIGFERKVLVSEIYEYSLKDGFDKENFNFKSIMHQLSRAVKYLQENFILHLDLVPKNIFLLKHQSRHVVKLTNFDKAQKIERKYFKTKEECIKASKILAHKSFDIYSLGKVFIYILENSQKKERKFDVNHDSSDMVLGKMMCQKLMDKDYSVRFKELFIILENPFFWSASRTLHFIVDVSKMLSSKNNTFRSEIHKGSERVTGPRDAEWTSRISSLLLDELKDARKAYCAKTGLNNDEISCKGITSLITTIRNMIVHPKTEKMIEIVGKDDEAFVKFWTLRFPNLILHLYETNMKYEENKEN